MGAVLIFAAPLIHAEFSKKNPKVEKYKDKLNSSIEAIEFNLQTLELEYESGSINAKQYITSFKYFASKIKSQEAENDKLLSAMVDSERIFDWKTMRIFLIGLGTRIPFLFFSILISFFIVRENTKDRYLSKAYTFLQVSCYTISFYLLIWVFWPSQDFSLEVYRWGIIASCVPIAIGCTYFIKYYDSNRTILKSKIRYIMYLMINKAVDKGHIKDENKYEDDIIYPALKKLDE